MSLATPTVGCYLRNVIVTITHFFRPVLTDGLLTVDKTWYGTHMLGVLPYMWNGVEPLLADKPYTATHSVFIIT